MDEKDDDKSGGGGDGNKDWRTEAESAGYEVLPASDMKELKEGIKVLKDFRALIPENYQGKEADFFKDSTSSITKLKELEDADKSEVEKLTGQAEESVKEVTGLKTKLTKSETSVTTLKKEVSGLYMAEDLRNLSRERNINVHPKFVTDEMFDQVDRTSFDLDSTQGKKDYSTALWENILKPALDDQDEVVGKARGVRVEEIEIQNGDRGGPRDIEAERKAAPAFTSWGNMA